MTQAHIWSIMLLNVKAATLRCDNIIDPFINTALMDDLYIHALMDYLCMAVAAVCSAQQPNV